MTGIFGRIFRCARSSFKNYFRNTNSVMWMLVFPFLITSVAGFLMAGIDMSGGGEPAIYVQDLDDTNISRRLVKEISEEYPIIELDPAAEPRDYVKNNSYSLVFIIPEGFKEDWVFDSFDSGKYPIVIETSAGSYICEISAIKGDSIDNPTFIVPEYSTYSNIISDVLGKTSNVYILFFPSVAVLSIAHVVINKIISEKIWMRNSNYDRILNNTNLEKHEWALSQMLWMIIPGIICLTISFAVISLFKNLRFSPMLFFVAICTVFVSVSLGLIISFVVKSLENSALASSATIIVMLQLSGGLIPLYAMPSIFSTISRILPTTYMLEGFTACLTGNTSLIINSCLMLLAFALIFLIFWVIIGNHASKKEAE